MALNVTTAVFRPGFNIATASPSLVQWDQGQMLQFEGVELPSAYQVEFTNAVTVQAITMIGNENGVEIPNELLQQSFPINAYIVLHETAEDRETEYWATIYVKARQQPREETPDPEQISVIDQTIAALQDGVAEAQAAANEAEAASQAVQDMGVEAETLPEGSAATVEKTVDPETGEVTLGFGIPEGRHGATGATPDIQIGTVTTGAPGSQADASITGTREEPRLNLTIPQGPQGDAGVTSVNGKTGAVVLDASDVGAKPASYEAPVSSVNGKTGAVVLSASDVGAKPASYEAPVSSVNEKTGAVVLDSEDIRYDSTETYSDGTVGKELGTINSALTSLSAVTEIIDTASGAIASFPDGSGLPMRSLVAQINPVQDLHGYDSPWPAGGGKNKFDQTIMTDSASWQYYSLQLEPNTTYIVSSNIAESLTRRVFFYETGDAAQASTNAALGPLTITTTSDGIIHVQWQNSESTSLQASWFMVRLASVTDATFAPYSNVCPISGWTGLSGQRTGVNLLNDTKRIQYNTSILYLGTDKNPNVYPGTQYVTHLKPGTYTVSTPGYTSVSIFYARDASGAEFTCRPDLTGVLTVTKESTYATWIYAPNSDVANVGHVQLELGSTASPYEEYTGEEISVSFLSTVYGGTDEVISGNGTSTMGMVDLGTLSWSYNGAIFSAAVSGIVVPATTADRDKGIISSAYPVSTNLSISASMDDKSMLTGSGNIYIRDTSYTTASDFKTAVSGVQLCYELATPQSFTHTGQSVDTLVGQNNVFVDTGSVEVTYPADTKLYIDKKIAELGS